jgi:hypothetical protein
LSAVRTRPRRRPDPPRGPAPAVGCGGAGRFGGPPATPPRRSRARPASRFRSATVCSPPWAFVRRRAPGAGAGSGGDVVVATVTALMWLAARATDEAGGGRRMAHRAGGAAAHERTTLTITGPCRTRRTAATSRMSPWRSFDQSTGSSPAAARSEIHEADAGSRVAVPDHDRECRHVGRYRIGFRTEDGVLRRGSPALGLGRSASASRRTRAFLMVPAAR